MSLENTAVVEDGEEEIVNRRGKKSLDKFALRRIRTGKTKRERENGVLRQRFANLADRAAWINETRGKVYGTVDSVPRMPKAHGLGNSSKRNKIKPAKRSKG